MADMTDKVLKVAKPADVRFYQLPNLNSYSIERQQDRLDWSFAASLLAVADEVIE